SSDCAASRSSSSSVTDDQSLGTEPMIESHCSVSVAIAAHPIRGRGLHASLECQPMEDGMITRLADLLVGVGANVQPHQILCINAQVGQEDIARAIAARAYEAGARGVEVVYDDKHVKRARIEHGTDEAIGFAPSWQVDRIRGMGDQQVAVIAL